MFGHLTEYGYMWGLGELYPPYIGAPGGATNRLPVVALLAALAGFEPTTI